MNYNYVIIIFGDLRIEGWITDYEMITSSPTARIEIDGVWYKTGTNNVLLMYKEEL